MLKVFIMVVSILTNDGQIEMKALRVDKCPDAVAFSQTMDKMKTNHLIKEWNALCIPPQSDV